MKIDFISLENIYYKITMSCAVIQILFKENASKIRKS